MTDIDIDFANRDQALLGLAHVPALIRTKKNEKQRHPSGVYFQDVPVDPFTNTCSIDYVQAEELGYVKIDFLNYSLYEKIQSKEHMISLLNLEPNWGKLSDPSFVSQLNHIRDHFTVVNMIKPQNIEDLAIILALIRPGKSHLIHYPINHIRTHIWANDNQAFSFKRAHAISYAAAIVIQMNLLREENA